MQQCSLKVLTAGDEDVLLEKKKKFKSTISLFEILNKVLVMLIFSTLAKQM